MTSFDFEEFIAARFGVQVSRSPVGQPDDRANGEAKSPGSRTEPVSPHVFGVSADLEAEEKPLATLPRSEAFSPGSSGSMVDVRLKVWLTRLQLEAQERAQAQALKLDHAFKLTVRRLEIEADTKVQLRQVELQNASAQSTSLLTPGTSLPYLFGYTYDVRRHVEAFLLLEKLKWMHILVLLKGLLWRCAGQTRYGPHYCSAS